MDELHVGVGGAQGFVDYGRDIVVFGLRRYTTTQMY